VQSAQQNMKKQNNRNKKLVPLMASVLMAPLYGYAGEAPDTGDTSDANTISVTGSTVAPEVVRLKMSPITSTVVGAVELDKIKFTNTTELLNRIPGVSKSRNLRIPAGGKGYTIPLIDGLSVRNPYRGSTSQIDDTNTMDIERIEVIHGPGSALYGSNAFGGVINIVTKEPPKEQKSRVWAEAGSFDRTRSGITTSGTIDETSVGDIGYFLDATYWNIGGYRDNAHSDRKTVSGKLVFHPTASSKLWIRGEHLNRDEEGAGKLNQAQFDSDPEQNPESSSILNSETNSASVGYSLQTDQGEFLSGFAYRHDKGSEVVSYGGGSTNEFKLQDMDFKTQYRHDFLGGDRGVVASLTTGLELVYSKNDSMQFRSSGSLKADENVDMFSYAPFAQLELMPTEKAKVTLGLRYEKIKYDVENHRDHTEDDDRTFSALSPKLGFTYDLTQDHTAYAGFSQGFAAPSDGMLFVDTYSNPDLSAERVSNYEVGMRGSFDNQNFSYDFGLYYMNIKDYIVSEPHPLDPDENTNVNAGKVNLRGIEGQFEYQPLDYLRFGVSYTYARNKYQDYVDYDRSGNKQDYSGNFLASSPRHHINARVTLIPANNVEVELEMDSYSSAYTNSDNSLDPSGKFNQKDIFNLRVNYETGPVELWLSALNITDEKYATRVSYSSSYGGSRSYSVGDGRSIYAGVAYNF